MSRADQEFDARAFFWTWERDDGSVRYTASATWCWNPVIPQRLRAEKEGFWTLLPCRRCLGCLKFQCLILARRLRDHYRTIAAAGLTEISRSRSVATDKSSSPGAQLFEVRIYCQQEKHVAMNRRIRRWKDVQIERGFCRAGTDSMVVLSRSPLALVERLRRKGFRVEFRPLKKLRRLATWIKFVRGLLISRDVYGKHLNRFYFLGLAPRQKETFTIVRNHEYKPFDRARGIRASSQDRGNLVPSKMFQLRNGDSLRLRNIHRRAANPEALDAIVPEMYARIHGLADHFTMRFGPEYQVNKAEAEAHLEQMRARKQSASIVAAPEISPQEISLLGGYATSQPNDSPTSAWEAEQSREQQRIEQRKRLWEKQTAQGLARLRKLAKGSS